MDGCSHAAYPWREKQEKVGGSGGYVAVEIA